MGRHGVDQIGAVAAFAWVALLPLLLVGVVCPGAQAGQTSEYRRQLGSAIDMPLDADVFRPPPGYNAPEQVHITQGNHDGTAMIISWVTTSEPGSSTVIYGTSEDNLNYTANGKHTQYTFYNYTSGYIHHCTIKKLEFDTKYYYAVGVGQTVRKFWFMTPPESGPDVPYTFGLIGDLGQSFDSNVTLTHYESNAKAQAVLFVGDLSYADNYPYHDNVRWDTWARFVERNVAYQPWIWTAGNHEIDFCPELGETKPFKPFSHRYPTPYKASVSTAPYCGRWAPSPVHATLSEADSWSYMRDLRSNNGVLSRTVSIGSKQSDTERHVRFAEPAYSFVGMHCIFDNCKASVTILKFGRASSDLLAYGAADGSLTVCQVSEPPSVLQKMIGHSKHITDFDFSSNNQYIASCSLDKTLRVWEISKGTCIRVVYGVSSQLCICFHPVNNNLLLVGNANKEINAINFSTGRVISKLNFDDAVTALDIDHTGQFIFSGDAQGYIYTVSVNSHTGSLSRTRKNKSSKSKSPITTIQYRTFSLVARCPVLLSCAQDGNLSFFSISTDAKGYLTLISSLKLASRVQTTRASFCPLLSLEKGEFIVTGREDANVYFYDLARPKNSCVNKLQGHGSPVIGVAWNHGENFLASSDSDGTVIVWKRSKTN